MDQDSRTLTPRRLTTADIPACVGLSTSAGWNQGASDWQILIASGHGLGLVDGSDRLVATTILLPNDRQIGWIGMVLVADEWRRRGIATRLMKLTIGVASDPILGLDATEDGRPLYERLGFRERSTVTRYAIKHTTYRPKEPTNQQVIDLSVSQFRDVISTLTRQSTESKRYMISAIAEAGMGAIGLMRGDRVVAVATLRKGRIAIQIGPILASDAASASSLLQAAIERSDPSTICIDVPDHNEAFSKQVENLGFEPKRDYSRMFRGGSPPVNPAEYVTAGPDFG